MRPPRKKTSSENHLHHSLPPPSLASSSSRPRMGNPVPSFALLAEDLLFNILSGLASESDRKSWRLVCRDFLRVELLHRRSLRVLRHEALPVLLRLYRSLLRLDLSDCSRVDDHVLSGVFADASWARGLRSLVLSRACGIGSGMLEVVARSCPCLEDVDLSHCCWFADRDAAALSCAGRLKVMKLVKCLGLTDVGLAKIAVGCGGLRSLDLKWCLKISDLGIDLLSKKCSDLRFLDISYLKITNNSLFSITSLKKLESLSIVHCPFIDDNGLDFLGSRSDSLQIIDVSRCSSVSFSGLISIIEGHQRLRQIRAGHISPGFANSFLSKLKDLKKLNSVSLDGFQGSHSVLQFTDLTSPNLSEIGLSRCMGIRDGDIIGLVRSHLNLKVLDITCCRLLTDDALSAIANSCKELKCLKLESCFLITEKGFKKLGNGCRHLRELDLTDCSINDSGLECVCQCSELIELKLGLCQNISDKGLFYIGSNCKKLEVLDLYRCDGVGDNGVGAIAIGCRKLRKLNLCFCSQITDTGLKYLSTLGELSVLELRSLLHISYMGLTAIAIGCKSLVKLDIKRCYSLDDMAFCNLAQHARNIRQINISYCPISDVGLCFLVGNMGCLQNLKALYLTRVSLEGFELALRTCWERIKKVKLCSGLKNLLSLELVQNLRARGCRVRWIDKPLAL